MSNAQFTRKLNKIGGSLIATIPDAIAKTSQLNVGDKIVWIINGRKLEVKFE